MTHMTKTATPLDAKPLRTTAPASLLSQWWTLGTITADRRTTGRHAKVAWVIIDRYRQDFGNGRASVRYIARACDLSASIVSKACRELVEWGYFSQNIGVGTRPTEFTPNWATVPPLSNAKAIDVSVLQGSNTSVLHGSNANFDSVLPVSNESYLLKPADRTGLQLVGNEFDAAPLAPLSAGLATAEADTASGGFDEFWSTWPRKHGKAAARVAFGKVDKALHSTIMDAAIAWASHYAKHDVETKWIPEPANWLKGERWDEDMPIIHGDAKGAAITTAKANAPTKAAKSHAVSYRAQIVESAIDEPSTGETTVRLGLNWSGPSSLENEEWPVDYWHEFYIQSNDSTKQAEGTKLFGQVASAVDVDSPNDTEDFHFRMCIFTVHPDGTVSYAPPGANDNEMLAEVA